MASDHGRALLDLQLLGASDWDAQADAKIIRDVVAADRDRSAVANDSIVINDVICDSSSDIDYHGAGLFLRIAKHDLGRSDGIHHHIVHIDIKFLNAADRVLNPGHHPVNNVVIGLQLGAEHSERIDHTLLTIDIISLDDRMQDHIFLRDRDLLGLVFDIADFFFGDFTLLRQRA